jgi:hypothetical protein
LWPRRFYSRLEQQQQIVKQYDEKKITESAITNNIQQHYGITGKKNFYYRDPIENAGGTFHMYKNVVVRFGVVLIELSYKIDVDNHNILRDLYGENANWEKMKAKPPQIDTNEIKRRSAIFPKLVEGFGANMSPSTKNCLIYCQVRYLYLKMNMTITKEIDWIFWHTICLKTQNRIRQ